MNLEDALLEVLRMVQTSHSSPAVTKKTMEKCKRPRRELEPNDAILAYSKRSIKRFKIAGFSVEEAYRETCKAAMKMAVDDFDMKRTPESVIHANRRQVATIYGVSIDQLV